MFIREEDWLLALIKEGGFSSITFWVTTIMSRGGRVNPNPNSKLEAILDIYRFSRTEP
jgi:hypothetical protein